MMTLHLPVNRPLNQNNISSLKVPQSCICICFLPLTLLILSSSNSPAFVKLSITNVESMGILLTRLSDIFLSFVQPSCLVNAFPHNFIKSSSSVSSLLISVTSKSKSKPNIDRAATTLPSPFSISKNQGLGN